MFNKLSSMWLVIAFIPLIALADENVEPLTKEVLKEKYGQEGTNFNDGKSCYRQCDGQVKTCYYEFNAQSYDAMNGLCGTCANETLKDCFNKGCLTANGVQRSLMTINQQMPGPTISVCQNDRVIIDVTNHMEGHEFSLHWHGLQQKESPWYDGVPMVTQCPIFAGNSFRYIYRTSDLGTHLYHAHTGMQRTNGIFGRLTVRGANDTSAKYFDYDLDEHSLIFNDWNNMMAEEKAPGIRSEVLLPDSYLINGLGQYVHPVTGAALFAPMTVLYVERGSRHRFRTVNAGSHNCPIELSIKDHNLTVIGTDGNEIEPVVVQKIIYSPGERFDFILTPTANASITETLLTIRGLLSCERNFAQEFARIVIVDDLKNYTKKLEHHAPLKERPTWTSLNRTMITLNHPHLFDCQKPGNYCIADLQHRNAPSQVGGNLRNEEAIVVPFTFRLITGQERYFNYKSFGPFALNGAINNITNSPSPLPGLIQDDSNVPRCNMNNLPEHCNSTSLCHCSHVVELEVCKLYEFLLIDGRREYQVIDMGTRAELDSGHSSYTNATHLPVIKDTAVIPGGGYLRFRFRSCNPGYWFFHCHFEYHTHAGMTATIKVGNRSDMLPPPFQFPTCGHSVAPVYDI